MSLFFLSLLFYFLFAIVLAGVLLLPAVRDQVFACARHVFNTTTAWKKNLAGQFDHGIVSTKAEMKSSATNLAEFIAARRYLLLGSAAIVSTPPLIAFLLRHHARSEFAFKESFQNPDKKVSLLLAGERLVPPPELPPDVFITKEVELIRPALVTANRKWDALDAEFSQRLLMVYKIMLEKYGYEMAILEGYRSPERQEKLATLGSHVTNARAYQSYHQFGLAADNAFYRNGRIVISEKDPWAACGYALYGEVAESLGLTWGGRWKMMDLGHVELRRPGVLGFK